jgi:hypothetical protein
LWPIKNLGYATVFFNIFDIDTQVTRYQGTRTLTDETVLPNWTAPPLEEFSFEGHLIGFQVEEGQMNDSTSGTYFHTHNQYEFIVNRCICSSSHFFDRPPAETMPITIPFEDVQTIVFPE